jgi:predicted hydrocarbon binding protein
MKPAKPAAFRERLVFDQARGEIMDETRRYMLIRPEALMGLFRRLPAPARRDAMQALADSIFLMGSDSARAYRALGADNARALADTVAATAPQLGWGVWSFAIDEGAIRLSVENSPFAAGFGAAPEPVCTPIAGMLRAVSSMILEVETEVREIGCRACGENTCRFEATPRRSP